MKLKEKLVIGILGVLTLFACVGSMHHQKAIYPKNVYQVYLDGKKIGLVDNKEELLSLINEEQQDIKDKYKVLNVYPPTGFEIEEYISYDENISSANEIYKKIQDASDFTIEGYIVTITKPSTDENTPEVKTKIQVLDEQVFKDALENVVKTFVDEDDYRNYINNTQEEIKDVGSIIKHMYFEESVSIKKAYVSVKDKIYTDKAELSQYLLYGTTEKKNGYKVQVGDTLESIAEASKLNVRELLIANPSLRGENTVLNIGEEINNSIIDPIMNLVEEVRVTEDVDIAYEKKTEVDENLDYGESVVAQAGVLGKARTTQEMRVINGERSQETTMISYVTLREKVDEITKVGRKTYISGQYIDTGLDWAWPTNQPYIITTDYENRWGSHHDALDISGTGFGSPIYSAREGTVVSVNTGCPKNGYLGSSCGSGYGNYIIINHGSGYDIIYAHLSSVNVGVGSKVSRGQVIGAMGNSGSSTGTHLHFGTYKGEPMHGGTPFNPWSLYR